MSHLLPPSGSPQRDMFTLEDLVAVATGQEQPVLGIQAARRSARATFAASQAVKRVVYIVLEADDRLSLVSVGRRLGWKREWTFGYGLQGNGHRP